MRRLAHDIGQAGLVAVLVVRRERAGLAAVAALRVVEQAALALEQVLHRVARGLCPLLTRLGRLLAVRLLRGGLRRVVERLHLLLQLVHRPGGVVHAPLPCRVLHLLHQPVQVAGVLMLGLRVLRLQRSVLARLFQHVLQVLLHRFLHCLDARLQLRLLLRVGLLGGIAAHLVELLADLLAFLLDQPRRAFRIAGVKCQRHLP